MYLSSIRRVNRCWLAATGCVLYPCNAMQCNAMQCIVATNDQSNRAPRPRDLPNDINIIGCVRELNFIGGVDSPKETPNRFQASDSPKDVLKNSD